MIPLGILTQQILGAPAPPSSSTLTDGLVSWWEMDEASGTRVDIHGPNDLTTVTTVTQVAGKLGQAGQFVHASNEYLRTSTDTGLEGGDRDWSFAVWVKADTAGNLFTVMCKGNDTAAASNAYFLTTSASKMKLYISTGAWKTVTANTFGTIPTDTWFLICCSHEASTKTIRISVNGGAEDSVVYTGTALDVGTNFNIGIYGSTTYSWDGAIDQPAFWDRLLTADERTELYNDSDGVFYADITLPPTNVAFVDSTTLISIDTGANTIYIDVPTHVEGDMMVIHGTSRNSYIGEPEGSGWTPVYSNSVQQNNLAPYGITNDVIYLWYKFAGASEPATYGLLINDSGTDCQVILCAAFRNATGVDCVEMYGNNTGGGGLAPSTLAANEDMLVSLHGCTFDSSNHLHTKPTSMTLIDTVAHNGRDTATSWAYEAISVDEVTGDRTWLGTVENDYEFTGNFVIRGLNSLPQPVLTNLLSTDSRDLTGYSKADSPIVTYDQVGVDSTPNTATWVEDDSASYSEYIYQWYAVSGNFGWYTARFFIKKDAVPASTRNVEMFLRAQGSTTIPTSDGIALNWSTDDGVIATTRKNSGGACGWQVNSWDDDWWEVILRHNNEDRAYQGVMVAPASGDGTWAVGKMGSTICGGIELYYDTPMAAVRGRNPNPKLPFVPSELADLQIWVESDISTLYQDDAKTTPVTADGDPVGAWEDKSGNGNDFTIGSSPDYRPTYKTDYIRGDGTDESLVQAWTTPDEWMLGIKIIPQQMAGTQGALGSHTSSTGYSTGPYIMINSTTTILQLYMDASYRFSRATSVGDETTWVIRVTKPAGNYLVDVWIDGAQQSQYDAGTLLSGAKGFLHLFLGYNSNGQYDIPGMVYAIGSYTDGEAEDLATYLGNL